MLFDLFQFLIYFDLAALTRPTGGRSGRSRPLAISPTIHNTIAQSKPAISGAVITKQYLNKDNEYTFQPTFHAVDLHR
jgi:hypothetical protein